MAATFLTNCVGLTQAQVPLLDQMTDNGKDVTYKTFRRLIGGPELDKFAAEHGYDTGFDRGGLRIKDDWHVAYFRSTWDGRACAYLVWSGFEYIWLL